MTGARRPRSRFVAAAIALWCSAAIGFAGGDEELAGYEPSPAAAGLVAEFERYHERAVQAAPSREQVAGDTQRWLERAETLEDDTPARHYLLARVEYEAYNLLWWSGPAGTYLQRAHEHIRRFAELNVAYAPGFALYGSILGRMIAANPPNALAYAGTAEQVTRLALELDPGNQMARLTLGLALLNTPEAFGGDPERGVEELRTAFAGEGLVLRSLAGVWLAVAYARLGRNDEAAEAIAQVLDLAPGFRPARATAEALAQGVGPLEYWQQIRERAN